MKDILIEKFRCKSIFLNEINNDNHIEDDNNISLILPQNSLTMPQKLLIIPPNSSEFLRIPPNSSEIPQKLLQIPP